MAYHAHAPPDERDAAAARAERFADAGVHARKRLAWRRQRADARPGRRDHRPALTWRARRLVCSSVARFPPPSALRRCGLRRGTRGQHHQRYEGRHADRGRQPQRAGAQFVKPQAEQPGRRAPARCGPAPSARLADARSRRAEQHERQRALGDRQDAVARAVQQREARPRPARRRAAAVAAPSGCIRAASRADSSGCTRRSRPNSSSRPAT